MILNRKIGISDKKKVLLKTPIFHLNIRLNIYPWLGLIGGLQAIIELPTNFKSVIVVVMFCSIFVPMFLSSLYLAMINPMMIFGISSENKNASKIQKYLSVPLCFVLLMINQIFLTCLYQENKEKARKLAQNRDSKVVKKIAWCREIKEQLIKFAKLELGLQA